MATEKIVDPRPLVLHIVESYAGGVRVAIDDYIRNTPGYRHGLVYSPRDDAPLLGEDFESFDSTRRLPHGHFARIRAVREAIRTSKPALVHAHSSFGGAYARLAVRKSNVRIIYTPHCYAYEREDLPRLARLGFRAVETALQWNTTVIAACSPREADLARGRFTKADVVYVPNVMPSLLHSDAGADSETKVLVGAGRASRQKDPDFFARSVEAIRLAGGSVEAIWIGGDDDLRQRFAPLDIRVTGWIPRDEAMRTMQSAFAYLHSARWEGFPLAILEAAALRTPTIARDVPSFDGLNFPLKARSPEDVAEAWAKLDDPNARQQAIEVAGLMFAENTDDVQALALKMAYTDSKAGNRSW